MVGTGDASVGVGGTACGVSVDVAAGRVALGECVAVGGTAFVELAVAVRAGVTEAAAPDGAGVLVLSSAAGDGLPTVDVAGIWSVGLGAI
jgi:hypothetical protein